MDPIYGYHVYGDVNAQAVRVAASSARPWHAPAMADPSGTFTWMPDLLETTPEGNCNDLPIPWNVAFDAIPGNAEGLWTKCSEHVYWYQLGQTDR